MNNLKRLRKEQGVSVTELASRLSMSQANLTKIENAQIGLKPEVAQKIAAILNVSVQALLQKDENKTGLPELELINPEVLNLPAHTALPVMRANAGASALYIAPDDTMSPTISKEELVIVDTSVNIFKENGVYLLNSADNLMLARLQTTKEGRVTVIFDNKNYPGFSLLINELKIKAKVLSVLKHIDFK